MRVARPFADLTRAPAPPRSRRSMVRPSLRMRIFSGVEPSSPRSTTSTPATSSRWASSRPASSWPRAVISTTSRPSAAASAAARPAPPGRDRCMRSSITGTGASGESRSACPSTSRSSSTSPTTTNISAPPRRRATTPRLRAPPPRTAYAPAPGGSPGPWRSRVRRRRSHQSSGRRAGWALDR